MGDFVLGHFGLLKGRSIRGNKGKHGSSVVSALASGARGHQD